MRFNPKLAKAHRAKLIAVPLGKHGRRSAGRFTAAAQGSGEVAFTDEVEQLIPENDAEAQLFDEEVYEDAIGQDEVFEVEPKITEEELEDDVMEAPAANPAGNFFGTTFGKTNGGAIALANSFSTGKSGQAMSTSTAYGQAPAHHAYAAPTPVEEVFEDAVPVEEEQQLAKYRRAAKLRTKAIKPRFGKLRSKVRAAKLRVAKRH